MGRGVHRGFITHEELNKSLGKRNLSNENLEQAFIHILDEKIILVEKKQNLKFLERKIMALKRRANLLLSKQLVEQDVGLMRSFNSKRLPAV